MHVVVVRVEVVLWWGEGNCQRLVGHRMCACEGVRRSSKAYHVGAHNVGCVRATDIVLWR